LELRNKKARMESTKPWHGFKGKEDWPVPVLVAASNDFARADQGNKTLANEYLDSPEVLEMKMEMVCQMIKKSKNLCAYTGAGLSKSSGIPDYATKSKDSIVKAPKIKSSLDALPTYAHCVLTTMERAGYLKFIVQQNHDGLPQKSGFPEEKINEIHGAWFDPSNPVVQFSGSLRTDLFQWMLEIENSIDMCLCLGTSLSGMNADRVANTCAKRAFKGVKGFLGTVIINIQQTSLDERSTLRVWAKLDDAFTILAKKLGFLEIKPFPIIIPEGDVFVVPYNDKGEYCKNSRMILDLRKGAEVMIPVKGAMNEGCLGVVNGKREGHFSIYLEEKLGLSCSRLLGKWWIESAIKGSVPQIPIVNRFPKQAEAKTTDEILKIEKLVISEKEKEKIPEEKEIQIPDSISIVQSHELVTDQESGDNIHLWGLSLSKNAEEIVDYVTWALHPTFRDPIVKCTKFPFVITRRGWGVFKVKVSITLKRKIAEKIGVTTIESSHYLDFSQVGEDISSTNISLKR
jgi:NAD-dependent SIR2 family protein deacetylase